MCQVIIAKGDNWQDLNAVQALGPSMSKFFCSEDQYCSVAVEEPVCLEDREDDTSYLRTSTVVTLAPRARVCCSARCRRDLHSCLALLAAGDAPVLASIGVVILNNNSNKSLVATWTSGARKAIITHTLRRKDTILQDLGRHVDLQPRSVGFMTRCPAGFYLISSQKICDACPVGTWSREGDNVCMTSSDQISDTHQGNRVRRCPWYWYPGYSYVAMCWALALTCAGAAAVVHRAPARAREGEGRRRGEERSTTRSRPLSPSRVILAKFFRGSRSCTRNTDSQETKFGLWKEQHSPPPLPPIDFDSYS